MAIEKSIEAIEESRKSEVNKTSALFIYIAKH